MTSLILNSRSINTSKEGSHRNSNVDLDSDDFSRMANLLYEKSGILLTPVKKTLLEGRIRKRLVSLGFSNAHEYCEYLLSKQGQHEELESFINVLTTNKTDFMREYGHFQYLLEHGIPQLLKERKHLRFWSAACSRGAEPYTLAMVLQEYLRLNPNCGMTYQILATDISTKVLQEAILAIYAEEEIHPVPVEWRSRYLLRGRSHRKEQVRIVPEIRAMVEFVHLNLLDSFPWNNLIDVVFCRNVTIYFDRETQNRLVRKFLNSMYPDGLLIMGHSESLDMQVNPIRLCAPSIYQRSQGA